MTRLILAVELLTSTGWLDVTTDTMSADIGPIGFANQRRNYPRSGAARVVFNNLAQLYTPDSGAYGSARLEPRRRLRIRATGATTTKILKVQHSGTANGSYFSQSQTQASAANDTWVLEFEARAGFDSQHNADFVQMRTNVDTGALIPMIYSNRWVRYTVNFRTTAVGTSIEPRWYSLVTTDSNAAQIEYKNVTLKKNGGADVLSNGNFANGTTDWTMTNVAGSTGTFSTDADYWVLFNGVIQSIKPAPFATAGERTTTVQCIDAAEIISLQSVQVALQKSKRGDQLATAILNSLPVGDLSTTLAGKLIETGKSTFGRAFNTYTRESVSLADALLDTATSEYGAWWVDRDGTIRWVNRDWLAKRILRSGDPSGGAVPMTAIPANNDIHRVDGTTYTFKTTLTGAANEVLIGATADASANNLCDAINGTSAAGVTYGLGTVPLGTDRRIEATNPTYNAIILADGPDRYYRFEETSGVSAADSSGNGQTATYNGSPTLGTAGLLATRETSIKLTCDGVNDDVTVPVWDILNQSWSVEMWLQPSNTTPPATQFPWAIQGTTAALGYVRMQITNTSGAWQIENGTTTVTSSTNLTMGGINHVVVTYDLTTTTLRLWLNGVQVGTSSAFGAIAAVITATRIGSNIGATWYEGDIDEVALYKKVLSAAQVNAHYAARFAFVRMFREGAKNAAPLLTLGAGVSFRYDVVREDATVQNEVTLSYRPRELSTGLIALTALSSSISVPPILPSGLPGETTVTLTYKDSTGRTIGGENVVSPVAVTDYTVNEQPDGTGVDYTSSSFFQIANVKIEASQITMTFRNTATGQLWVNAMNVRGNGIYIYDPISLTKTDAVSQRTYQRRAFSQDLPFSNDQQFVDSLGSYRLNRYAAPYTEMRNVVADNRDTLGGTEIMAVNIGDVIRVTDAQTGLSDVAHMVIGVQYSLSPSAPDWIGSVNLTTERLDQNAYWILGDATYGVLDTTTRLYI